MDKRVLSFCMVLSALSIHCGGGETETDPEQNQGKPTEISFEGDAAGAEARFSPDGASIAFVQSASAGDSSNIAVMNKAGEQRTTLAPVETYLAAPAWAPDGKSIYFTSDDGISVVAADGGEASVVVSDFAVLDPDVSPDGKSLVYGSNGGNLKLVDLASPGSPQDLGVGGTSPRFSPDGASIAFESGGKINLMVLASGEVTEVLDAGTYLASVDWFPDGKKLAITSDPGIEIVTLGGNPERDLVVDEFAAKDLDLSPDGKTIVYGVNGSSSLYVLSGF